MKRLQNLLEAATVKKQGKYLTVTFADDPSGESAVATINMKGPLRQVTFLTGEEKELDRFLAAADAGLDQLLQFLTDPNN